MIHPKTGVPGIRSPLRIAWIVPPMGKQASRDITQGENGCA